ncbi:MAG: hypothetical protein ACK56F_11510 [bacterium]
MAARIPKMSKIERRKDVKTVDAPPNLAHHMHATTQRAESNSAQTVRALVAYTNSHRIERTFHRKAPQSQQ